MKATIIYTNTAHEDQPRCMMSLKPNVWESVDVHKLRYKLVDLQYFLYRPDYILVEFNGYIYDATDPSTKTSKELMSAIDLWAQITE